MASQEGKRPEEEHSKGTPVTQGKGAAPQLLRSTKLTTSPYLGAGLYQYAFMHLVQWPRACPGRRIPRSGTARATRNARQGTKPHALGAGGIHKNRSAMKTASGVRLRADERLGNGYPSVDGMLRLRKTGGAMLARDVEPKVSCMPNKG